MKKTIFSVIHALMQVALSVWFFTVAYGEYQSMVPDHGGRAWLGVGMVFTLFIPMWTAIRQLYGSVRYFLAGSHRRGYKTAYWAITALLDIALVALGSLIVVTQADFSLFIPYFGLFIGDMVFFTAYYFCSIFADKSPY